MVTWTRVLSVKVIRVWIVLFICFIFCRLCCFDILKKKNPSSWGQTALSRASQFIEIVKGSQHAFDMQINDPEPYLLHTWLDFAPQEVIFVYLNHPKARNQATRDHRYDLKPGEIIQTVYPFLPFISRRSPNKGSGLKFPLLSSACCPGPCVVPCLMLLGPVSLFNFVFLSLSSVSSCGHP